MQGGSKNHYFCKPSHTPLSSTPALLTQFIGIPMVFIFPSRAGGSWQAFTQTLDSAQQGGQYSHCFLAIGLSAVTWPAEIVWSVGTPPPRLRSAVPLSSLWAFCACMWSFLLVGECVGECVSASGQLLVWGKVSQLCFGSFQSPRAVSVWAAWPQRLRISTWEWTITAGALGTGWAGSLPGSNCSRGSLEVGEAFGYKWQFRLWSFGL